MIADTPELNHPPMLTPQFELPQKLAHWTMQTASSSQRKDNAHGIDVMHGHSSVSAKGANRLESAVKKALLNLFDDLSGLDMNRIKRQTTNVCFCLKTA